MSDFAAALPATWFDETSDETWFLTPDGSFIHEWHSDSEPHQGTYDLLDATLTFTYEGGLQTQWTLVSVTATELIYRTGSGDYSLRRIG